MDRDPDPLPLDEDGPGPRLPVQRGDQPARSRPEQCSVADCTAWAVILADPWSYALDGRMWLCTSGHQVPEHTPGRSPDATTPPPLPAPTRAALLADALLTCTDSLTTDFDLIEFLQSLLDTGARLFDAEAAGLLFADSTGALRLIAASCEDAGLVELAELGAIEGPGVDSFRSGQPVSAADIRTDRSDWRTFTEVAAAHGIEAAHALPMRIRDTTLGACTLFASRPGALSPDDVVAAQALTNIATMALLQERLVRRSHTVAGQLQTALGRRVTIEQAKGVVAASDDITIAAAYARIRDHARTTATPVHDIARRILDRALDLRLPS